MISHNVVSRAHVSTTVMFYFEVYCIRVVFKRLKKKKKGSRENQNTNDPQHSSRGPRTVRNSGYAERKKKKRKLKPRFFFVLVFLFLSACMRTEFPSLHFFFFFFTAATGVDLVATATIAVPLRVAPLCSLCSPLSISPSCRFASFLSLLSK